MYFNLWNYLGDSFYLECIVEINVEWKDFRLETSLRRYTTVDAGIARLIQAFQERLLRFPNNYATDPNGEVLMPLTAKDCYVFNGAVQINLLHAIFDIIKCRHLFKVVYRPQ